MPNNDHEYSDNSPSDNSPSEGDPDSEDKQATESGTESNSSSKQEQSAESKTSSSFSDSSSDKPTKKRDVFSAKEKEPGGSPTFPVKLHLILSNPEFEKIVAWLPHGRAWRILDHKALEEKVIPLYFRHGRYSSFARQINGWGFKRIVHGADYNAYYHEMFLRGMPHLCAKMKRPTSKSNANKEQVDPTDPAPDFYAMSRIQPLPEAGSTEVPPHLAELMEMEKGPKPAVIDDTPSTSSAPQGPAGKSDVLEQIAQLLNQNRQQQQQNQSQPGSNPQLAKILSLLNGNGAAAPPKPAAPAPNQLQQLLSGLGGNNEGPSMQSNNSNPQAQLAALLQQQLQPQQKPPQPKSPQDLLASLLNQNAGQNNQADMLSNLLNQGGSQNSQQPSILNALMNSGNNPANLLQVLSNQLEQKQQPSSQQQQQQQQQRDVSAQNQDKTVPQDSQQQQKSSRPTDRPGEGDKAEDASQGSAKRQRQSQDADVSTARSASGQGMSGNIKSSDPSNIAALLGQLSGQSGGQQQNAVTGALSQLIQSMSQKPSASNNPRPLDFLSALQQSSEIPESQQQPKSGNALANVLSVLQQRGSQAGQMGSSNDAILSAVKQLQGVQQGQDKPAGSQDAVSGLLQQIMGNSQQGQGSDSSGSTSGNPVLDALQSLVRPAQQPAPAPAAPPANNPFAQLQQLLGQNQPGASQGFASMQQGQRNNGGPQANSDLLASLGLNQGGNNPNAAMLQQLLNNSNNGTNNPSSNPKPQGMINAELLASLGLPNGGPSSGPNSSQQNAQSRNQPPPGLNPQFLGNSASQSGSSMNGGNATRTDFSMSQGQSQGRPGGNQQPNNESAARSVAAILSAFNQGKK